MKFLFMCGREVDYTRNQVLLRAFQKIGQVDVIKGPVKLKSLAMRSALISLRALPMVLSNSYDYIFVGFYGHLIMLPVGLFSHRPIIFDAFVSTYDTLISDRQAYSPGSIMARLASSLDRSACHFAERVLVDTPAQQEYFSAILGIPPGKLSSLPVACNEDIFFPRPRSRDPHSRTQVLSYSTFLPIHGINTILQAATLLKDEPIEFKLIGDGPLHRAMLSFAQEQQLHNVIFCPPVNLQQLAGEIAAADICLGGHFGTSEKAARVIPGKIYQMLAMAKPVIAADTPANEALLHHGVSAYLVPAGDAPGLAEAILKLTNDQGLCERISQAGRVVYETLGSEKVVTDRLQSVISGILQKT